MHRLTQAWANTVRHDPGAIALLDSATGRSWSRAEVADQAVSFAASLSSSGIRAGHRVVVAEPNGLEWIRGFVGLLELGAVPVLVDPGEPQVRREEIAGSLGCSGLLAGGRLQAVAGHHVKSSPHVALIKLTSGTTGRPRGLVFRHDQMLADGRQVCASMGIGASDRNLAIIPFGHSYGLGNLVVPLLEQGTAIVVAESPLPQSIARECVRFSPTIFPAVPPVIDALAQSSVTRRALRSVRLVISAGARLSAESAAAFHARFGILVHGFYGSSETGGISFDRGGEATLVGRSVGTPMVGVRVRVGKGGRFSVSSAAVCGRGIHKPGDRISINDLGEIVLIGRTGRFVKVGGRRVDPMEVERMLRTLPEVDDAFVTVVPDKADSLAAVISSRLKLSNRELRKLLKPILPSWKIPDRIMVLDRMPATARGKIDTKKLAELLSARPDDTSRRSD